MIKYHLHKEILKDLSKAEEERLLEKVMMTPHYKLLANYRKDNGCSGIGMHSWDKFLTQILGRMSKVKLIWQAL